MVIVNTNDILVNRDHKKDLYTLALPNGNILEFVLNFWWRTNNNSVINIRNKDIATDRKVFPKKYNKPAN